MEFLKIQLPIILLSFVGVMVGRFLGKFLREEVEPGRKYFMLLRYAILLMAVASMIYHIKFEGASSILIFAAIFVVGFLAARFFKFRYLYLGFAIASGMLVGKEFLIFVASLVFLYGLAYGTTLLKKDMKKRLIVSFVLFLFPVALFALLQTGELISIQYLLAFTAGALFLRH